MWLNPQFLTDLITFTEKILNEKLYFLCSVTLQNHAAFNVKNYVKKTRETP